MTQHLMNQALDLIRSGCADTVARERDQGIDRHVEYIALYKMLMGVGRIRRAMEAFEETCREVASETNMFDPTEALNLIEDFSKGLGDAIPDETAWDLRISEAI